MNPKNKGWLKQYVSMTRESFFANPQSEHFSLFREYQDPQLFLYRMLQPTGLLYGYPLGFIGKPPRGARFWSRHSRMKVLIAGGFLHTALFVRLADHERDFAFELAIEDLNRFALEAFPERDSGGSPGLASPSLMRTEAVIDQRLHIPTRLKSFWTGFFTNSLLYYDLIHFLHWQSQRQDLLPSTLEAERNRIRMDLLRIIAAAAHSDQQIVSGEKDLFSYFLYSSQLSTEQEAEAQAFFRDGIELDDFELDWPDSWILKKYCLELGILTLLANREISASEARFMNALRQRLGLSEEDMEQSLLATEGFVNQHYRSVHYFQKKQNFQIVGTHYLEDLRKALLKNKKSLQLEIAESKELVNLLNKSRTTALSVEEKRKVRSQLLDILKAIPALTIFLMPGGLFTLAILMKVIPKELLFPSSFQD